jgi:hypothetical protein
MARARPARGPGIEADCHDMKTRNRIPSFLFCAALAMSAVKSSADDTFHNNVVIVLDASGSMKSRLTGTTMDRMTGAKAAIKAVLGQVPQSTHIGLLVFSAKGIKDPWVFPLGPRNDSDLIRRLDGIEAFGNTPLGVYMKQGADRLLAERARQFGYGTFRLLVVTDGEADDRPIVERHTPELQARGITLDVIGVGMSQDHTLAKKVHSYRRANDPAALNRAVSEVFAEVSARTDDKTAKATFEIIAMIQALSSAGTQPLGVRPSAPSSQSAPVSSPTVPNAQAAPAAAAPPQSPAAPAAPPPVPSRKQKDSSFPIVVFMIVVFVVAKALFKRR